MPTSVRAQVEATLRQGEQLIALTAMIPARSEAGSGLAIGPAIPVAMLLGRLGRQRKAKHVGGALGFTMPKRALLAVTHDRLMIWALRKDVVGQLLGEIPTSRIRSIAAPTVGQGWRTCHLTLTDGSGTTFRVVGKNADVLAATFPAQT